MTTPPRIKTLFLFEDTGSDSSFFELEGDYRHLNNVYINAGDADDADKEDELDKLVYKRLTGRFMPDKLLEPTRDWTYFVKCGFIA